MTFSLNILMVSKHFKVWLGNAACSVIENVLHAVIKFKFQMMFVNFVETLAQISLPRII